MAYKRVHVFYFWKLMTLTLWFYVLNTNEILRVLKPHFYLRLTCVNISSVALVSFSRYFLIVRDPKIYQLITLTFLFFFFFLLIRIMWVEVLQTFCRIESIHQKQTGISILNTVIVWLSKKSLRRYTQVQQTIASKDSYAKS